MIIQDLVVTGIVKFLRLLKVDRLVVEEINDITKNEIDALQGVTGNIQTQLQDISTTLTNANTAQTSFKSSVASAINAIPKENASIVQAESSASAFTEELNKVRRAIVSATASEDDVLEGKKFVKSTGIVATGTMNNYHILNGGPGGDIIIDNILGKVKFQTGGSGYYHNSDTISKYFNEVASAIGLNAAKIVKGNTILGVSGNTNNVNTVDASATSYEILSGRTAYVKGVKVVGDMKSIEDYYCPYYGADSPDDACINFRSNRGYTDLSGNEHEVSTNFISTYYGGEFFTSSESQEIMMEARHFGNATASDIRKGRSATSINGLDIAGTMNEIKDYFYHPNASLQMRTRTSYTDDTGTTKNIASTKFLTVYSGTTGYITSNNNEIMIEASRLGDATTSDVLSGKTFTSSNGLKVAGTMNEKSSGTMSVGVSQVERTNYLEVTIPEGYYPSGCKINVAGSQLASDWKTGYVKAYGYSGSRTVSAKSNGTMTWNTTLPWYIASNMSGHRRLVTICGPSTFNGGNSPLFSIDLSSGGSRACDCLGAGFLMRSPSRYSYGGNWCTVDDSGTTTYVSIGGYIYEDKLIVEINNHTANEVTVTIDRTVFVGVSS